VVIRVSVVPEVLGSTLEVVANILGFNGSVLSVVGDAPVDSEAPTTVTLSITFRGYAGTVFECAHRDRVYICAFIWVNIRAL
jgi:hypothetical protein